MAKFGIDVSDYQGKINWQAAKEAGVEFAILRSIQKNMKPDNTFETNFRGCRENGIQLGVYKYGYATTVDAAKKEATAVLQLLAGRPLELPVFYDAEDKSQRSLPRATLTEIIRAFLDTISGGGYKAAIYCNLDWYQHVVDVWAFTGVDFWIARYGNNNGQATDKWKPNVGEVCWQYSSRGQIPGISGNVDVNLLYKDYGQAAAPEPSAPSDTYTPYAVYQNGSTAEPVYSTTGAVGAYIGSLDPYEKCDCLGIVDGMAMVLYTVSRTGQKKTGFVKWLGGVKA